MKIGDIAKDMVTGFQGAIIAHSRYLHNCDRYALQPKELHEGVPIKSASFDEPRVEKVADGTWEGKPTEHRRFDLGDLVKDRITGFEGIATSCTDWDMGCDRWGVTAQELKDGRPRDVEVFDGDHLELVQKKVEKLKKKRTGGPQKEPTR